jgi:hypothetical protein
MIRILAIAALSGFSLLESSAAESSVSVERTCRILFLGPAKDAPDSLVLFDGTAARRVQLPSMNLSPVYKLPGGPLVLRLLQEEPAKPEDVPPGAPVVRIGETTGDFYLLATNDPSNKVIPVAMQVIHADRESFRNGQTLWFNLTSHRVGGKLGSNKLVLEPDSRKISAAPARDIGSYPVELYYQMPGDPKLWPLCETQWQHNPAGRTIIFVFGETGSRVPRIMGFPDFRAMEE